MIDAAGQYYLHGQRVFNAVEPIALAVMLAEQEGEQAQLRRALSIQGLILTATRNTPDALRSLLQALELAERMDDVKGVAAAWVNIAVTFFDATLYNDARVCYERGAVTASSIEDPVLSVYLRCRALYGAAQCDLYLHEYLPGVDACDEALQLMADPKDREQEQVRALVEATYAQLLLALHRTEDAAAHAAVAREMAARSGAAAGEDLRGDGQRPGRGVPRQRRRRHFAHRGRARPVEDPGVVVSRRAARLGQRLREEPASPTARCR